MSKSIKDLKSQWQPGQTAGIVSFVLAVFLLTYVAWSGAFTVNAHEQSVVLRFGAYNRTVGPGLHFKIPWVEERIDVDVGEHSLRLPWGQPEQAGQLTIDRGSEEAALILTGDLYAAVVEWNVMWRVVNPQEYLFSIQETDVEAVIISIARSSMNQAVGDYAADESLTFKRAEVGQIALDTMRERLKQYRCGIDIFELQMQRVTPPNQVKPAFDEVNSSIQKRDQLVNEARREQNQMIPLAEAKRDQLVREAEGYSARRLAESQGEISALKAKWQQYQAAPEATRQRLYLETMERVLEKSGPKLILDAELKGLVPLLNFGNTPVAPRPVQPQPVAR